MLCCNLQATSPTQQFSVALLIVRHVYSLQSLCFVEFCFVLALAVLRQLARVVGKCLMQRDVLQELRSVRRAIKCEQRRGSRARQAERLCGLTPRMVREVLAVYVLSQYDQDCAVEFAMRSSKKRKQSWGAVDKSPYPIRQWFLDADMDTVVGVLVPETCEDRSIRSEAVKFLAERRTAFWVASQNFRAGQAPTGCHLVDRYCAELRRFGLEARFTVDPPRAGRGVRLGRMARKWCQSMKKSGA